jgi:HK97 family phage major capsid protein
MSVEVKAKQEQVNRLISQARELRDRYPAAMPQEVDDQLTVMVRDIKSLRGDIDTAQRQDATRAAIDEAADWFNKPAGSIPHGINGDADDHKSLRAAGWETKGGNWYAPTSLGPQVMFPVEVLAGDIPQDDAATAQYYKSTRAAMAPEYKTAYAKHLAYTARFGDPSMAFNQLTMSEQKALSEGSDPAGGFLVPPDVQAEVLARVAQMSVIRSKARIVTTNRDKVRFPAVAPNSTSGSIYSSGFVGGWVGETPAFSDTDPSFQLFDIDVKKVRVATKLSNDFVSDAAINVLAWLAANGAENMSLVEDQGFLTGNGGPLQPLGILNTPGLTTVDVEGSTSNTISNTTSNTGSGPKIINLAYAVPAQYVSRASWLMRRSVEAHVRQLTDASGRPLWLPTTQGGFDASPRELAGYPVYNSDFMPVDDTDTNQVILFGDLSQYIIAQRAQITSVVLRERFADTDQIGLILFARVGGALWNVDAVRVGVV